MTKFDRILIGGPSQAGKTTLAKKIAGATGYQHVQMDIDRLMLATRRIRFDGPRNFLRGLRGQAILRRAGPFTVVEGHQIAPAFAAAQVAQQPSLMAVFVGYPTCDIQMKIKTIRDDGRRTYLTRLNDVKLGALIARWRDQSAALQAECHRLAIPFVDLSDLNALHALQDEAVKQLMDKLLPSQPRA